MNRDAIAARLFAALDGDDASTQALEALLSHADALARALRLLLDEPTIMSNEYAEGVWADYRGSSEES